MNFWVNIKLILFVKKIGILSISEDVNKIYGSIGIILSSIKG